MNQSHDNLAGSDGTAKPHGPAREQSPAQDHPAGEETRPVADDLVNELERLRAEREELNSKFLRTLADYQNFQRRSIQNEQAAKIEGVSRVVERVFTVLDHFDLALNQDTSKATADQIVHGVRLIRDEFTRVLASLGVGLIAPSPSDEFVPGRHEAVMQQPADGIQPGRVVACFQPGYTLAIPGGNERVLRPAKVAVSPAS